MDTPGEERNDESMLPRICIFYIHKDEVVIATAKRPKAAEVARPSIA
jgi:hypothetical protein